MSDIQGKIDNTNFDPVVKKTKDVKKAIKEAFDPNDVSGLKDITNYSNASKATENLTQKQKQLKSEMNEVGQKMLNLNADSSEYNALMRKMINLNKEFNGSTNSSPIQYSSYSGAGTELKSKTNVQQTDDISSPLMNALRKLIPILEQIENKAIVVGEKIKVKFSKAGNTLKESFSNGISKTVNLLTKMGQKAQNVFGKLKNNLKSTDSGFNIGLKSILKYASAMFGLRSIYSAIRQSASSWLSSSNSQAQQLNANINYMRYALGSTLAPVMQFLVQIAYNLLRAIQSVVYALTKVNIFAKATASSMNSASSSASKTSKSLAGVHSEINNVSSESSGGGTGSTGPNMDLSSLGDVSGKFFDAIANGDWSAIGKMIADKLNSALASIPWDKIKSTVRNIGVEIANFFNSFIGEVDWYTIGNTISQGINTAINFSYGFFSTFDFSTFGYSLGTLLMSAIENIDWSLLAQTLSARIKGAFDTLAGFITALDWKVVMSAIIQFFSNIDWSGISDSIFNLLGSAMASLLNLGMVIGDYIKQAMDIARAYFQSKIEECGGNVVLGILKGIGDAVLGIGKWIYDHIFSPFINGFKNIFGIHSPSTVMAEMGSYIMQGLLNGISNLISKIGELWNTIKTNMKNGAISAFNAVINVFGNLGNRFKTIFSNAWTSVKNVFSKGGQVFVGIKEGIETTFKAIVNGLIDGINSVVGVPFKAIKSALDKIRNVSIAGIQPFTFIPTIKVPQIPHLATGNVAYQQTLAVFGEYAGARNNPEITTPQNILRETFRNELQDFANNSLNSNSNGLNKLIIQFGSTQVALEMEKLIQKARRQNGTATATI